MRTLALFTVLLLLGVASARAEEGKAERLHGLFQERFERLLVEFPDRAMARGDYTNAHVLAEQSVKAIERRHADDEKDLERLLAIGSEGLSEEHRLSYEIFELLLRDAIENHDRRDYLMPLGGRFGPHLWIPQMGERVRFQSTEDYGNYFLRLEQVPLRLAEYTERMTLGMEAGLTPPRITLRGVPGQFEALMSGGLDRLAAPLDAMPAAIDADHAAVLRARWEADVFPAVEEAMRLFRAFVVEAYLPACRDSIAAADLPDGEAYYAQKLRQHTTTLMTAQEIHEIGLSEVDRIRAEMMGVIRRSDFMERREAAGDLEDDVLFSRFLAYLRADPRFYYESEEELLTGYRDICKQADAWLPKMFGVLPRLPYGVREIPAFMAPNQTTAFYRSGDIRNGEPGWFYANTFRLDQRPRYEMVPLALHEAVPGHHLQIALAKELEDLPEFRKDAGFTAYVEGWALYSERLGIEHGMYDDPYDDFGRLLYEMWRACRLVVDPGMHALGWTRDRAIAFMQRNTALSDLNIETEIDRYIGWPGQACAYKVGELVIRALREKAESELEADFDIRAFHDVVLGAGALPLSVLEDRVHRWIAEQN